MFILHSSNKTENLAVHLAAVLKHPQSDNPLTKEIFLIQSQGMERWLSQQLASQFKVWANYEFYFPSKFFSYIGKQLDSQVIDSGYDRQRMLWHLDGLLRTLSSPAFAPLQHYLSSTNPALKRYQLAQHIAYIFDQYQIMRPELLAAWEARKLVYGTDTERWQQALWQSLKTRIPGRHRGELCLDAIAKLADSSTGEFEDKLPARISVFGINTMPPLFLNFLQAIAKHCDVHFYLLNPAQTYWADLARKQKSLDTIPEGHPLLASLGQQGREFQAMLLEQTTLDIEPQSFEKVASPNNLQQLQNDILGNVVTGQGMTKDNSISIHACHSRKREVEILHDLLLHRLEQDTNLQLHEIAVMAPDIQQYESFISAIFFDIQHAIADRNLRLENHLLDVFIRFLELSQSRLGWQSVLDVLEIPEILHHFDLDEAAFELIRHWVKNTNVRWGQSGFHKQELGLPELNEYTWQSAMDRLFMGYAVCNDDDFVDGIIPYPDIEGSSAEALGGLHDFLQLVFQARTEFKQDKPLRAWGKLLLRITEQLFGTTGSPNNTQERQQLHTVLSELSDKLASINNEPVAFQVILQWMTGMMSEHKSSKGFLRGQLTFCSMLPMRSIPFKVIALLGLNEGEFPNLERSPTYDLIALNYRHGDRSRRSDDRYQFLEILLAARQQLIITYIGQSSADNKAIPPSVVVTELLDALKAYYQLSDLITFHPLQAFSKCYFDGTEGLFSYSQENYNVADTLTNTKLEPSLPWWLDTKEEVKSPELTVINIADFFTFYQHPQRYFFRKQFGFAFQRISEEAEENEPFKIDGLDLYQIQQARINKLLSDSDLSLQKLQAKNLWTPGAIGELTFKHQHTELANFVKEIKALKLGSAVEPISIDLEISGYRLIGKLPNRHQNGSLFYRYANLKGKDFMQAWLHHLLVNQTLQQDTYLLAKNDRIHFIPDQALPHYLPEFIDIYLTGKKQPIAFFTEASLVYLEQYRKSRSTKSPSAAAIESLVNSFEHDSELKQLYGNTTEFSTVLAEQFEEYCINLLLPAWVAAHED